MPHWSVRTGILGLACLVAACPLVRPGPDADAPTRGYPATTRDQVLQAATEVFMHADPSFALTRSAAGMEASRPRTDSAFGGGTPGFQQWQLRLQETDGGVRAWLEVLNQEHPAGASEAPGMRAVPAMDLPEPEGSAVYELFFSRLDQRLGKRPDWITCEEARMLVREGTLKGSVAPLCERFGTGLDAIPADARITCPAHRPHISPGDHPVCMGKARGG